MRTAWRVIFGLWVLTISVPGLGQSVVIAAKTAGAPQTIDRQTPVGRFFPSASESAAAESGPSVPEAAQKGIGERRPQDVLLLLDDAAIPDIEKLQAVAGRRTVLSEQAVLDERAAALTRLKAFALKTFDPAHVKILRDYSHLPMAFVRIFSLEGLRSIVENPGVKAIYEDRPMRPFLNIALPFIGQPAVAGSGKIGAGTTVAVLDQRIEFGRPEFGSCVSPGVPASCRVVALIDVASPPLTATEHGTNVAAIVAAVAPGARIASLNVFGPAGTAKTSDVIAGINSAIANKATFNIVAINLSLGSDSTHFTPCFASPYAIPVANALSAGIVTVAAAGNDGHPLFIAEPACVPKVVSVGAVYDQNFGPFSWNDPPSPTCLDATTGPDQVTCFSNSASILTMFAPGAPITAGGHTFFGTSQATPFVAGSIAVLRSAYPAESLRDTIQRLVTNASQVVDGRSGLPKPRLNLLAATNPLPTQCPLQTISLPATTARTLRSGGCVEADQDSIYYADVYRFSGTGGQTVTLDVQSSQFDTEVTLRRTDGTSVAENDDASLGTSNSHLSFALPSTGTWDVWVSSKYPYMTGSYSLAVSGAGSTPCAPDAITACLLSSHYRVRMTWTKPDGTTGSGQAVPLTSDTAYFYFFSPNNVEAVIKVVDGRAVNGKIWVFAAGLTNVRVAIEVVDTVTGSIQTFINPQGVPFAPIQKTDAFATTPEESVRSSESPSVSKAATAISTDLSHLLRLPASVSQTAPAEENTACVPDAATLCLNSGRFQVRVTWTTSDGRSGAGQAISLTGDTGYFWFFSSNNVEAVIKVVTGCPLNSRYWVFAGGLTNVNVVMRVTDTQTGVVRSYVNPQGIPFQPIQDTNAFACP